MTPVIIVGMVAGVLLIVTAVVVFIAKKEFSTGGVAITLIAMVLIGMSQWSKIKIEGAGIKIETARDEIRQTAKAADEVAAQLEQTDAAIASIKAQLANLTRQIENSHVLPPNLISPIRDQLNAMPKIDLEKLSKARTDLRRIAGPRP